MLLRCPQLELSLAGEVDGFAEDPQRFLRRVEARIFGFDEIEIELRLALEVPRRADLRRRHIGGARCFQVGNQFHECVHPEIAHPLRAFLDDFDPALQFRFRPFVTRLAGAVDVE